MNRREVKMWREVYLSVCGKKRLGLTPNPRQYRKWLKAADLPKGAYPIQYEGKQYARQTWLLDRLEEALK
jgi:hypothetical protein